MKAKILKYKTMEGYYGKINNRLLYRVGPDAVPQLFPDHTTMQVLDKIVDGYYVPDVKSLDDFELINVEVTIIPVE